MKVLKLTWARVIISFFVGGIINEIVFLTTGDITRPRTGDDTPFVLFYALIVYLILTWYVNVKTKVPPPL